jgi:hypothetical protein
MATLCVPNASRLASSALVEKKPARFLCGFRVVISFSLERTGIITTRVPRAEARRPSGNLKKQLLTSCANPFTNKAMF